MIINTANKAEKALRQAKEELREALFLTEQKTAELDAAFEAVPEGLTVYNKNGDIIYINDTIKKFYKLFEEGLGEYFTNNQKIRIEKMKISYPDGRPLIMEDTPLYRAINYGETAKDYVTLSQIGSDKEIYSSASCAPIRNSFGEITGAVMLHYDVTNRIKLEKETEELVEKLRQADQNKNVFINMLSHELRNPLASIMMSLDLLDQAPPGGEQAAMALEIARRQGKQLTHMVDDLLDINRISQNKVALKKENVELNEIIKLALLDNEPQFRGKSIKLNVASTSPLYLNADALRLTQVIGNLLHNAAKFTSQGDLVTVTISHDTNNNEAIITVQDTGCGIESEYLENLFEPFTQVDTSLDRNYGGLGLGLAIVKGMVELHGGRVEAFSEGRDKGARFGITLPLLQENIRQPEQMGGIEPASNESLNILMIDDNKDLTDVLCGFIELLGHKTAAAYHGTEGIVKAQELRPDVIICDIGLPGMNGYEVAKKIREDTGLQHTCLIALSGYAQSEDIERSIQAGFDQHLGKPVSIGTLQQALNIVNRQQELSGLQLPLSGQVGNLGS